jgi:hypothetical protein
MRPNVKYHDVAELFLHKRQQQDLLRPSPCRCLSNAEALIGVAALVFIIGMAVGVWLCQNWR